MFDSAMFDVAIGLVLVYLVISLVCTAVNELISQLIALRAKKLEDGIRNILSDGISDQFYAHPLISQLSKTGRWEKIYSGLTGGKTEESKLAKPSYIPSELFAKALFDIIAPESGTSRTMEQIKAQVASVGSASLTATINSLLDESVTDIGQARTAVEHWFDNVMDRVSGQYKRNLQIITLAIAVAVVGVANADSYVLAKRLSQDSELRSATVLMAERVVNEGYPTKTASSADATTKPTETPVPTIAADSQAVATPIAGNSTETTPTPAPTAVPVDPQAVANLLNDTRQLGLPLGWNDDSLVPNSFIGWLIKVLGLLFTAVAVSLGAPFWFDMLSKFVRIRATGEKPASSTDKQQ